MLLISQDFQCMHILNMATSRIFIGGIPPGTTSDELIQRFKSFGDVKSCEVVPDKEYPGVLPGSEPMVFSRNFGFVTIEPKDEKSLQRAIAVYNGSLWRGCTLRCKLAKPTAMEQLAEERKEDAEISNEPVSLTEQLIMLSIYLFINFKRRRHRLFCLTINFHLFSFSRLTILFLSLRMVLLYG